MLRKIFKILLIIIASLGGLVLILLVVLGTGFLNGYVADLISKQARKTLNGEIRIGALKGSILSDFSLNDVTVESGSDTLLYSHEISIDYQLLPLLRKEVRIDDVSLTDINFKLVQYPDSTWNFMKLLRKNAEADTSTAESDWKIYLNNLKVERLSAAIKTADTSAMIPAFAEAGFILNFNLYGDTIAAGLDSMKIITTHPDLTVSSLTGKVSKKGKAISWNDIALKLVNSVLYTEGTFSPQNNQVEAKVDITPLDFNDLKGLLPDLPVKGKPEIHISANGSESMYYFNTEISDVNQDLKLSGKISDLKADPAYSEEIFLKAIDASHWLKDEKMKTDISGKIEISGKGFDIKKNKMDLKAEFRNLKYNVYSVDHLVINTIKNEDKINGSIGSATFAGNLNLHYDLGNVFGIPVYDILLDYKNINIGSIPGIDTLSSDLNGRIHLKGRGKSPDNIVADIRLSSDSSSLAGNPIGDFTFNAGYNRGNYMADIQGFGFPYFELDANGSGNIKKENNIAFTLVPVDAGKLSSLFGFPGLSIAGKLTGGISGNPDSLNTSLNFRLDSISYDTTRVEKINSEAIINYAGKKISGSVQMSTGKISIGGFNLKAASIKGRYTDNKVEADIGLDVTDSLQTEFAGTLEGFDNPAIRIKNLGIDYNGAEWRTPHDSAYVRLNENNIDISGFELVSGKQEINVNGSFAFNGPENINIELNNIDLETLPLKLFLPYEIIGFLTSDLKLSGTSSDPVLNNHISMDRINVNGFEIDSVRTDASYEKNLFRATGKVLTNLYQSVELMLDVPVKISFNDSIALLKDDPRLNGSIRIDSLDIKKLSEFLPVKNLLVEGFANADIVAKNTLNEPLISGNLRLANGRFNSMKTGSSFEDIQLIAGIDSSTVNLDTLSVRTGKGKLGMNGFISLKNTDSLQLNDLRLKLKADNFQAMKANFAELNFNSDLDLSGTLGRPGFKGNLRVNNSKINVDYFKEILGKKSDQPDLPLLIAAMSDTLSNASEADSLASGPAFTATDFYKDLSGEAVVDIPGNTWVTGKDMNFELNGSVRAVKTSDNISFFGDLNIKRGYYKVYGRNFRFEKGRITFTGNAGFNPDIDFEIVYSFRDIDKNLRDLKLLVTGKLMQPDLKFTLNDIALEEKDAISYIVFGKSVNQLGEGERQKISGQDVAMGAAVTQLSSALKDVLQESAGVDVFEVTGGEDWKSGSVTIGKYVTNNLFLSYDRSFDFNKQSKTPVTEKIMLEYQLLRNLMLKATNQEINSGFDLIWRRNWK
jgi:autotransporter translocation and assembly factor TamB